jgi:transducin (beta)-like 1
MVVLSTWCPCLVVLLCRCYHTLEQHTKPIYSVSFSPDGRLMASGAADKRVLIWDVASGQLVKSHEGEAGIFEVSWSSNGDLIAVSFQDKSVHVLDVRTWQVRKD